MKCYFNEATGVHTYDCMGCTVASGVLGDESQCAGCLDEVHFISLLPQPQVQTSILDSYQPLICLQAG